MLARLRPRSAYDVIALLALFVAVGGGTAFAVVAANQVNSASIINGQVKNVDLGKNSVGTGKVIDGAIQAPDLATGSVGSAEIIDGSVQAKHLAGGAVDPSKTALGSSQVIMATESTASTTGTDLATPGPAVTVHLVPGSLVAIYAQVRMSTGVASDPAEVELNVQALGGPECSGILSGNVATILTSSSTTGLRKATLPGSVTGTAIGDRFGGWLIDNPGSQSTDCQVKYQLKYRASPPATATFGNRFLSVTVVH